MQQIPLNYHQRLDRVRDLLDRRVSRVRLSELSVPVRQLALLSQITVAGRLILNLLRV